MHIDDCELIDEFLDAPSDERHEIATHLRRMLDRFHAASPCAWVGIPCRRPLGLYVLLPVPLAEWLAEVLLLSNDCQRELLCRPAISKHFVAQHTPLH